MEELPDYHDLTPCVRVAVPHHFNADPDSSFHFNADPDSSFHFNADPYPTLHFIADSDFAPDPACRQSDANLLQLMYLQTFQDSILSLHASIVRVHSLPRLNFEPLKLLHFDFIVWRT